MGAGGRRVDPQQRSRHVVGRVFECRRVERRKERAHGLLLRGVVGERRGDLARRLVVEIEHETIPGNPGSPDQEKDEIDTSNTAGDKNALGYFGFAYYEENRNNFLNQ